MRQLNLDDARVCPGAPQKPRPVRRDVDCGADARALDFEDGPVCRAPPRIRRYRTLRRDRTPPRALNFDEPQCPPAPQRPRALQRTPLAHLVLSDLDLE